MTILITGGAGYIGSNTCVELINNGYDVVIADNLSNSDISTIDEIERITEKKVTFYQYDLRDKCLVKEIFQKEAYTNKIDAVIHFAGLKSVSESVKNPHIYYKDNLGITLNLLEVMESFGVKNLVFSSSATVYANSGNLPLTEDCPLGAVNPYGMTKLMQERIFEDVYKADNNWNITLLRYFNPVGSFASGVLCERPIGIPNNLMPYIVGAAKGSLPPLMVFGNDYPTSDGTGVRDYIHINDLAKGHIAALQNMKKNGVDFRIYNLGTGKGTSVFEMIKSFEKVNNMKVPYVISDRRPGDIAICYAEVSKAKRELGWQAEKNIDDMVRL